jgi:undecaprenyl-diphosphatase
LLLALMLALHFWLVWVGSFPGDRWALERGWHLQSSPVRAYADVFGDLGTPVAAVAILLVGSGILLARRPFSEFLGLVVAFCAIPFNAMLKVIFGASPLWAEFHNHSANFPSGHVNFVTAVIGYLGLISWRASQRWLTALAALLVVGIGPARVVTGVHLVSDVVAGYLVGASWLILAYTFSKPRTLGPGVEPPLRQEDQ